MQIYLARNNFQAGPYTLAEFNQILISNQLNPDDLMWHEGLNGWQTVAQTLQNQTSYQPNQATLNLDKQDSNKQAQTQHNEQSVWDKYKANNPHKTQSSQKKPSLFSHDKTGKDIAHAQKQLSLAPIHARVLAKLIDMLLIALSASPLLIALINSPSFDKLKKMAESGVQPTTAQQMELLSVIPQHILVLTNVLVWGVLFAQMLLLIKRGQTLGKMAMGIRILDIKSNAIPKFLNLIVLRSILPAFIYWSTPFGILFLLIDSITALINKDRQSLHDKLAKSYVVIADDTQINPLELNPKT